MILLVPSSPVPSRNTIFTPLFQANILPSRDRGQEAFPVFRRLILLMLLAAVMGTSASAALAARSAAILRAARPDLAAAQIVKGLRSSATPIPTMKEPQLNLPAALALP
jgi:hypothetical protein